MSIIMRVLFTSVFFFFSIVSFSQTFYAVSSGNWSDATIWSSSPGGPGSAGVPGAGSTAYTQGFSITVDQNITIANLGVRHNTPNGIIHDGISAPFTINITGSLFGVSAIFTETVPNTAVIENTSNLIFRFTSSSVPIIRKWSYVAPLNTVIINPVSGIVTTDLSTGFLAVGESLQLVSGRFRPRKNIADANGVATLTVNTNAILDLLNASLTGTSGTAATLFSQAVINGTVEVQEGRFFNVDNLTLNSGANLNVYLSGPNQTEGWWYQSNSPSTLNIDINSNVAYLASNDQNIYSTSYGNLVLSGQGNITKAIVGSNDFIVMGTFRSLTAGTVINSVNTQPKTFLGNIQINGTWAVGELVYFTGTSNQDVGGATPMNITGGLEVNKPSNTSVILNTNMIVSDLSLLQGTINHQRNTLTLNGTVVNNGNITATVGGSGGILRFNGPSVISGTGSTFINHLVVTPSVTVTFNKNVTWVANLTNNGSLDFSTGTTINVLGGLAQNITGNSISVGNLSLAKTSGNPLANNGTVVLRGAFTRTSGVFDADGSGSGIFIVQSDASGDARIGPVPGGAITGNVTVHRYMDSEGRIYRYLSSPVSGATVAQLQDDFPITGSFTGSSTCTGCLSNPSMYYYDQTVAGGLQDGYFQYPVSANTETLQVGRGYAAFVRQDILPGPVTIDLRGPINRGNINLPVTFTNTGNAGADGYNLVGNPFPSVIDWDTPAGWTKNNISDVIAIRDNGDGGVHRYWDGTVGDIVDGLITTGQGFWIRATGGGPTLQINENAKATQQGIFFRDKIVIPDVLRIDLTKGNITDRAYIRIRSDATEYLDDFDGLKLDNEEFDIATLSKEGYAMAINATNKIDCGEPVRIKIKDMTAGAYSITIDKKGLFEGFQVKLTDKFTQSENDFDETPVYTFSITSDPASSAEDRFALILGSDPVDLAGVTAALETSCNEGNYEVTLSNTQSGISWYAELDGTALGSPVVSDGQQTTLSIPGSSLTTGQNPVIIKATNACATESLANPVVILHDQVYEALGESVTRCGEGEVTLEASGAPENGYYNWYASSGSQTPVEGQHSASLITPALFKTQTFYVAAVNNNGCEGPKTAIAAGITYIEPVEILDGDPGVLVSSYETGNQWFLNDEILEGETGQTIQISQSGTYTVEATSGDCSTSAARVVQITGVETYDPYSVVTAYPNPVSGILHVRTGADRKVNSMSIFSSLGAKVGDMTLEVREEGTLATYDMTGTADGIYFIKAILGNQVLTLKVIKR